MIFKFFYILFTVFIAEMGDKTQLLLLALSSKYKVKDIVLGTAFAILVLNAMAVALGSIAGNFIPVWTVKLAAGFLFLVFALSSLKEDDEEENKASAKSAFAFIAVFLSFFLAELGDKTQLAAFTFGVSEGLSFLLLVWLACSAGLFLADMAGLAIGLLIKKRFSFKFINILSFILFVFIGFYSFYSGLKLCPYKISEWKILVSLAILFLIIFALLVFRRKSCR